MGINYIIIVPGLGWFFVVDNLLEDIMLFGDFMKLSKVTTLKALCLDFLVNILSLPMIALMSLGFSFTHNFFVMLCD